jgi:hypothetical protein
MNISSFAMRVLVDDDGAFSEVCDGGKPGAPPCVLFSATPMLLYEGTHNRESILLLAATVEGCARTS